ncbi:hypothetical protein P5673_029891 [Acropora cervicornis]|uniref:Uncharacterized protein n=1 Tax=Acropora cervicornis TaxID=6130 RepID=A0AAD9PV53_ACRCE|nr:hypothetical protein P5673_029891 [Acropora cervicornis]
MQFESVNHGLSGFVHSPHIIIKLKVPDVKAGDIHDTSLSTESVFCKFCWLVGLPLRKLLDPE